MKEDEGGTVEPLIESTKATKAYGWKMGPRFHSRGSVVAAMGGGGGGGGEEFTHSMGGTVEPFIEPPKAPKGFNSTQSSIPSALFKR